MKIGPKYKIARRLGAAVFEKTQTQKFAINQEKKGKKGFSKMRTEFGLQLTEKQKARMVYVISEKQFKNYVKASLDRKGFNPTDTLFDALERRMDNVAYRSGFAPTRLGAKQMVSHGHLALNGRRVTNPSIQVKLGDKISINKRSEAKPLFLSLGDRQKEITVPPWIKLESAKKVAEIVGKPTYIKTENLFDLNTVIEFYSR
ncbi:MAG: 30S ribosomal protein S4 [Minisyncoccia bacterium]